MKLTIIRSNRKTISMRITSPDAIEIRAPRRMPKSQIDDFIEQHQTWIEKHIARIPQPASPFTEEEIRALADQALQVIPDRVRCYYGIKDVSFRSTIIQARRMIKWLRFMLR